MRQLKYIGVVFAALMLFTACEKEFDAIPEDFATVPEGSDEAWPQTVTIHDLIENFDTKEGLFTIDTIDSPNDIIVRGRVITDDRAGNVYKYFVIQSLDDDHTCLKVSVDAGSLSGMLPLGQVVAIRCNGLVLITEMDKYGYFKIVKIKDVYFTGYDSDGKELNDEILPFPSDGKNVTATLAKYALNPIFAPSTYSADKKYNIGFPRSRVIADDSGNTVDVYISTSEYARFADRRIPPPRSDNKGEITAIAGWFQDNEDRDGTWQLTVRSLDKPFADLKGFDFPQ